MLKNGYEQLNDSHIQLEKRCMDLQSQNENLSGSHSIGKINVKCTSVKTVFLTLVAVMQTMQVCMHVFIMQVCIILCILTPV